MNARRSHRRGARAEAMTVARIVLAAVSCCAAAAPAHVSADHPAFVISLSDCGEIDRALLLSLLELELSDVAPSLRANGPPLVELQCVGERLHVRVHDPVTGKVVARTVPRPSGAHGERSIALAVSQLFLTSWLELLLPEPSRPRLPQRPAEEQAAVTRRVRASVAAPSASSSPEERASPLTMDLRLLGGAGVRDVSAPIPTEVFSLRLRVMPDVAWSIGSDVGLEHGNASRQRGNVELWLAHVTIGAGATVLREGAFALELGAGGGIVWVQLGGQPVGAAVRGHAVEGIGARLALAATGTVTIDWLVLSLAIDAGVDLGLPVGLVSAEREVAAGGFFARALIGLGVRFGG